jgi:hypothetical protein
MKRFRFLSSWWSPLLTTPTLGFVILFVIPTLPLVLLNSRSALLALIAGGCLTFPWLMARIHELSPKILVPEFYLVMAIAWFRKPAEFDGNPKLALAAYLSSGMFFALILVAVTSVGLLRKKNSKAA